MHGNSSGDAIRVRDATAAVPVAVAGGLHGDRTVEAGRGRAVYVQGVFADHTRAASHPGYCH